MTDLRNYSLVTSVYWGFTLTGGALCILVLLHFHALGYSALQIAMLFLLYEFCGVLTNLLGGWVGSQFGLKITLFAGRALFGLVFAINSSVHSYLILAYTKTDQVALNVGFYYMANAAGRLLGTLLSGLLFQLGGLPGCLWVSMALVLTAGLLSLALPRGVRAPQTS